MVFGGKMGFNHEDHELILLGNYVIKKYGY